MRENKCRRCNASDIADGVQIYGKPDCCDRCIA